MVGRRYSFVFLPARWDWPREAWPPVVGNRLRELPDARSFQLVDVVTTWSPTKDERAIQRESRVRRLDIDLVAVVAAPVDPLVEPAPAAIAPASEAALFEAVRQLKGLLGAETVEATSWPVDILAL